MNMIRRGTGNRELRLFPHSRAPIHHHHHQHTKIALFTLERGGRVSVCVCDCVGENRKIVATEGLCCCCCCLLRLGWLLGEVDPAGGRWFPLQEGGPRLSDVCGVRAE